MTAWTWISYVNIRRATLSVGTEHVQLIASQIAGLYQEAIRDTRTNLHVVTGDSAIVHFVKAPGPATLPALRTTAARLLTPRNNRSIGVFALDGAPLFSAPDSLDPGGPERHLELANEFALAARAPDHAAFAPIRILRDSVVIPIIGGVVAGGEPAGFVVIWTRVGARTQVRDLLNRLIGDSATVFIGNARGDLWSDLGGGIHKFPAPLPIDGSVVRYERADSVGALAVAHNIEGTPWAIAVETPTGAILAPAKRFLRTSILASIAVLLVATFVAALLARRLTVPLGTLTQSARAMAAGDFSGRVPIHRADELGTLSESFNVMADRIGESQRDLERKVEERTALLRERNVDLETFVHSVSHDLRAPLRAMHGFSRALLEDFSDTLDETAKDYARRIASAAQRMDHLTQDLLTFSRVSSTDISLAPVELGPVVRDAVDQFEADITARHAQVVMDEQFPPVLAHRATLEQSIANLVGNGLKFVAEGRPPEIRIRSTRSNGYVRLWIEDNGIGIAPAHQERIFSIFERLHEGQQFAGTGMGLAIVRRAVERMGGRTGVESNVGAGSRFWIDLKSVESK
ncbi:MAG TPA: ATP-binding protein [Gemmatimonadaceae bacterium]|nr:ATP-binding protein [Gemmatimonadaceae bacterium]